MRSLLTQNFVSHVFGPLTQVTAILRVWVCVYVCYFNPFFHVMTVSNVWSVLGFILAYFSAEWISILIASRHCIS
jgi:hypothetical protein